VCDEKGRVVDLKKIENLLRLAYMAVAKTSEWPNQPLSEMAEYCIKASKNKDARGPIDLGGPHHWLAAYRELLDIQIHQSLDHSPDSGDHFRGIG